MSIVEGITKGRETADERWTGRVRSALNLRIKGPKCIFIGDFFRRLLMLGLFCGPFYVVRICDWRKKSGPCKKKNLTTRFLACIYPHKFNHNNCASFFFVLSFIFFLTSVAAGWVAWLPIFASPRHYWTLADRW